MRCGYRLVDTASIYKVSLQQPSLAPSRPAFRQNEREVGDALAEHCAECSDSDGVFVTSKVSPYDLGYDKCLESVKVPASAHAPSRASGGANDL